MAQLVEQRIRNAQVAGSSPATSSKEFPDFTLFARSRGFLHLYAFGVLVIVWS